MRKDTYLQVQRPGEILLQPLNGVKPRQADARIDLHMRPDGVGALGNGLFENLATTVVDVFFRKPFLCLRN